MIKKILELKMQSILLLGITFKENCPDVRNTKVIDVISSLKEYGVKVIIYDPWANEEEVFMEYGLKSTKIVPKETFDTIVLAVSHKQFLDLDFSKLKKEKSIIYDVKNILNTALNDKTL